MLRLGERRVDLKVTDQAIDTATPGGKLLFHMLAAIAEFERDLIRERTRDGLDAARAKGNTGGRRPGLTGLQAAGARRMYNSRQYTGTQIAGMFHVSRQTIYRHLGGHRRQFAIGQPHADRTAGPDVHAPTAGPGHPAARIPGSGAQRGMWPPGLRPVARRGEARPAALRHLAVYELLAGAAHLLAVDQLGHVADRAQATGRRPLVLAADDRLAVGPGGQRDEGGDAGVLFSVF